MGVCLYGLIISSLVVVSTSFPADYQVDQKYEGHQVLTLNFKTIEHQQSFLRVIGNQLSDESIDIWKMVELEIDIMVPPHHLPKLNDMVSKHNVSSKWLVRNVRSAMEEAKNHPNQTASGFHLEKFNRLDEINAWLDILASAHDAATVKTIGKTFEGRKIKALIINTAGAKNIFVIDAGIHAREWISIATALYMINEMLNRYEDHQSAVDAYEWHFIPVMNPDGYEYTHTGDRMWRKTRSVNIGALCKGVDPNRNFGYHWREGTEALVESCAGNYPGTEKETENNVKAFIAYIKKLSKGQDNEVVGYISLHSYSQLWLIPFAYQNIKPTNYQDMVKVAEIGASAIREVRGTKYQVGMPGKVLYTASGTSMDWAHAVAGIPYSYILELPPNGNGTTGFLVSPKTITAIGQETMAGVKAAAMAIKMINLNITKNDPRIHF